MSTACCSLSKATLWGVVRDGTFDGKLEGIGPAEVRVVRPGVGVMTPLPAHLGAGDELSTGPATEVVLLFPNDNWVLVRPNTKVAIGSLEVRGPSEPAAAPSPGPEAPIGRPVGQQTPMGEVVVKARSGFRVRTRYVNGDVEGTRYVLSVDTGKTAVLKVSEGVVALTSRAKSWERIRVHEGQRAVIDGGAPPVTTEFSSEVRGNLHTLFERFDVLLGLGP